MRHKLIADIRFGQRGNSLSTQRLGWSGPENGFTWTTGDESTLVLDSVIRPAEGQAVFIDFDLFPMRSPMRSGQSISIYLNNELVCASLFVSERICWAVEVPSQAFRDDGVLEISMFHPGAMRPSEVSNSGDHRRLGIALFHLDIYSAPAIKWYRERKRVQWCPKPGLDVVPQLQARLGMSASDLAGRFESLGDNCEFGFFQRGMGLEQLSLLRFSGIPLFALACGLKSEFVGLGSPESTHPEAAPGNPPEWIIKDSKYSLQYHTFVPASAHSAESMRSREARRLHLLRRKLLEDIVEGQKIFVCKRDRAINEGEALATYNAIRGIGDANFLWVLPGASSEKVGLVEQLAPRVLCGHIDKLMPNGHVVHYSNEGWAAVCCNAVSLIQAAS